jgi:hypothetical protein
MMSYALYAALLSLGLCVGMLLMIEVGRRVATWRLKKDPAGAKTGFGTIESAVLALLSLLLAFTVNGANTRFDLRRHLIVEEAVDIHTAYIRLDVLPSSVQSGIKADFRRYVDARLEVYRKLPDVEAANASLAKTKQLQKQIWEQAVDGLLHKDAPSGAMVTVLPALTAMIDISTTRTWMTQLHPPKVIFVLLFVLALASSLLSGYGMAADKSRSWMHMLCLAVVISVTVYVILDFEYPRLGFIQVTAFDEALVEVRNAMD